MARKSCKAVAVSFIDENGIKHTFCSYQEPKKSERTWPILKSKHSIWTSGAQKSHTGVLGTQSIVAV